MSMSRKILVQVTAPAIIVGLFLMFACLVSAWYIRDLQSSLAEILKENVSSMRAASQMEIAVRQLRFHCFHYLIAPSEEIAGQIQADQERFETWLELAQQTANTPKEIDLVEKIWQGKMLYRKEFEEIKAQVTPDKPWRDFEALVFKSPVDRIVIPCRDYLAENDRILNITAEESTRLTDTLHVALVLIGLIAPLAGILSGYGIARTLSQSIYRLSVQVQDMAQHLDHPVGTLRLVTDGDIHDLDTHLQHIVQRVEEVTNRLQRQQRELLRAQQLSAVGQLAACVAHEIRNPLTSVKILVGLALRPHNRKPLTQHDLHVIYDEVGRVEQTVQNLLDFARLPAPKQEICDLREVVGQAVELVRARALQQQVSMTANCPAGSVLAEVDRGQLSTVLVNLFLNALDAMPQGGCLEVDLHATGKQVVLEVTDTGKGISPEMMETLFTPFISDKPTGTGLGLSISRRIIEEHSGTLAASTRPEGGARFQITLPASCVEKQHVLTAGN
jgi:two-component system sensor histidine kinase HydH